MSSDLHGNDLPAGKGHPAASYDAPPPAPLPDPRVPRPRAAAGQSAQARPLRFEILGPVRAWRGDHEIDLGSPQQRGLLAALLLREGAAVTRDQLTTALWGDEAPPGAWATIRTYVSRLRRAMAGTGAAPVIVSVGGGYAVPAVAGASDLAEFQALLVAAREAGLAGDREGEADRLCAALRLWKGTALAGVRAEYAEHERARLGRLRLGAVEDSARTRLRAGRVVEAVALLTDVVAEEPLQEQTRVLLMLALYRSGRQAEALRVYEEARHLLAAELGLDPGPQLQRMQRRILASDPSLEGAHPSEAPAAHASGAGASATGTSVTAPPTTTPPAEPAPAPATPTAAPLPPVRPLQLPPDLEQFTGRADLVGRIAGALAAGTSGTSVPVLGLVGAPGVGTTALAVHVGHAVAADFPDGQLFVHMDAGARGGPAAPPTSAEVLATLLRGLGVADRALPASAVERTSLWRSLTAGRRLLVVFDAVAAAEHIEDVLPGAGGPAVLVTARRRLFGPAQAQWVAVGALPQDERLALLGTLIGPARAAAEPAAARCLADLTAGLPDVLHALAQRLSSQPFWSLATSLERLTGRDHATDPVPAECAAIARSYHRALSELRPEQARALRLLSLPEGPEISLGAAAALLGLPVRDAETLLESLADVHLIESDAVDRYRFLFPIRAFARSRALRDESPAARDAALARVTAFYAAGVRTALLSLAPGIDLPDDGVDGSATGHSGHGGLTFAGAEAARGWLRAEQRQFEAVAAQSAGLPDAPADLLSRLTGVVTRLIG